MPLYEQAKKIINSEEENGNEYDDICTKAPSPTSDYDMKIHPGQIIAIRLKKGSTFFRASRNNELPIPNWFRKEIKHFTEEKSEDWSGRYFFINPNDKDNYFPSIDDVKDYAPDFLDEKTGKGVYRIEQREVKEDIYAIFNKNRKHGTSAVAGDTKAFQIKNYLKINGLGLIDNNDEDLSKISDSLKKSFSENNGKLITVLDSLGLAYIGPHTEEDDDNELILGPHTLEKTKPKKITQVLAYSSNEQHELPENFLGNTNFESSEKQHRIRRQFLLEFVKKAYPSQEQKFLGASDVSEVTQEDNLDLDLVQSMQKHLDAELKVTETKGIPDTETASSKKNLG